MAIITHIELASEGKSIMIGCRGGEGGAWIVGEIINSGIHCGVLGEWGEWQPSLFSLSA